MTTTEGTIRFRYTLAPGRTIATGVLVELDAWRTVLRRLGLVGSDPRRYGGYGFGNLSVRDAIEPRTFWITATQTGAIERLAACDVCRVVDWDLPAFRLRAEGSAAPSSEALTHAAIYLADASVQWVLHTHDPDTWRAAAALDMPTVPPRVEYGTVEMAEAVSRLLRQHDERPILFATLGHEDGIFACGHTATEAGCAIVRSFAQALERR
jgi:ribulose-5-phosphate 4-epimerase/fuculose-1-phosphate aldolase